MRFVADFTYYNYNYSKIKKVNPDFISLALYQ